MVHVGGDRGSYEWCMLLMLVMVIVDVADVASCDWD